MAERVVKIRGGKRYNIQDTGEQPGIDDANLSGNFVCARSKPDFVPRLTKNG
jgi:hypothetical protein